MRRIALTGGIAAGKSAAAERLAELGAVIIDADVLAREVVAAGTPGLRRVVERFGPEALSDGALDRARLGALVFADAAARADLEAIIHPLVRDRATALEADAPPGATVVQVIPLLVETKQHDQFDEVVVVDVDHATQLARLRERSGLDEAAAKSRIAAQASRTARLAVADHVLDNSGSPAQLIAQVDALWQKLIGG